MFIKFDTWPSSLWSNGSLIYYYLRNQWLSPLKLWVWIQFRRGVLNTTLCDKVCQWFVTGRWFSPVSSTNKTDLYDIIEILLKVVLNTINLTPLLLTCFIRWIGCNYNYMMYRWISLLWVQLSTFGKLLKKT
jgi:hypothetical protein